jgi:hypothetical protein
MTKLKVVKARIPLNDSAFKYEYSNWSSVETEHAGSKELKIIENINELQSLGRIHALEHQTGSVKN